MIAIRAEAPADIEQVRKVNESAFAQPNEADIVDQLRQGCDALLSLVALRDEQVVGHILFSPATIEARQGAVAGMGLAPMAVLPDYQRQGIGSELVEVGLGILRERACPFVIVLGHPEYYPRFGFEPASRAGVTCQWPGVPAEAFMLLVLDATGMQDVTGVAHYRAEFGAAM